ncbi:MAG: DUF3467 domain-containing protein [Elusimicrobia bacterium]|nr:DUF3467 domain-containing protein [Elusimicrobiota bacterium]
MQEIPKIQKQQLNIKMDAETAKGNYTNMASVSHTGDEFIIDFMLRSPGINQATVVSRVITAPAHMKRLQMALNENISRYEKKFGKIVLKKEAEKEVLH